MNWTAEAHKSWEWLQWMREVVAEDLDPHGTLPYLIRGMEEWDEAIARDRHSVGDPDRIDPTGGENFVLAAAMMSRAAKESIEGALKHAIVWEVDEPMAWPDEPMARRDFVAEARQHWAAAHRVVVVVLQAWITLWNDLADMQHQIGGASKDEILDQWKALGDQASTIVSGAGVAAWAQTDVGSAHVR